MRHLRQAPQILITSMAIVVFLAIVAVSVSMVPLPEKKAGAAVRLEGATEKIICSGTYLGNGKILTAAHCTFHGPLVVKTAGGDLSTELLWHADQYDIALYQVDGLEAQSAAIDCKIVKPGDLVHTTGNPLGLSSILTYGTVASGLMTGEIEVDENTPPTWKERVLVDLGVAPGSSGGGLFDRDDHLVGIVVGMVAPYRYAMVVPSSTVCRVLGR